ncbi:hypothetical protein B1L04_15165 [Microcystis aeruginosa KW]|uniref:Uncharacterized protein n=1 Tax=Microcystis aeruginosa KW TaxID=1960155 RepID=A0A1V4BSF5_MICAE|nr:hypothetical protein B1L04_15165 [Microcystis aeruginosa KW]
MRVGVTSCFSSLDGNLLIRKFLVSSLRKLPTPYTLHPTPYTPSPHTLHPTPHLPTPQFL